MYKRQVFAAGEIAFIMQLGALLEDLTVAKARAGIEKLIHLTPQTARDVYKRQTFLRRHDRFYGDGGEFGCVCPLVPAVARQAGVHFS